MKGIRPSLGMQPANSMAAEKWGEPRRGRQPERAQKGSRLPASKGQVWGRTEKAFPTQGWRQWLGDIRASGQQDTLLQRLRNLHWDGNCWGLPEMLPKMMDRSHVHSSQCLASLPTTPSKPCLVVRGKLWLPGPGEDLPLTSGLHVGALPSFGPRLPPTRGRSLGWVGLHPNAMEKPFWGWGCSLFWMGLPSSFGTKATAWEDSLPPHCILR